VRVIRRDDDQCVRVSPGELKPNPDGSVILGERRHDYVSVVQTSHQHTHCVGDILFRSGELQDGRVNETVERLVDGVEASARRGDDQMSDGVDLTPAVRGLAPGAVTWFGLAAPNARRPSRRAVSLTE